MEKFEVDGNVYIFNNGKYYDEHFCLLNTNELVKVMRARLEKIDYKNYTEKEMLDLIKQCKDNEVFGLSKSICEFAMKKYDDSDNFIRCVLPIFTSSCRKLNMPKEAIERSKPYIRNFTTSAALNTSLAAAYCDIGDLENAKKYADRAYAKVAELPGSERGEISSVYERIKKLYEQNLKKETKEKRKLNTK